MSVRDIVEAQQKEKERLEKELGHVKFAMFLMFDTGDIASDNVDAFLKLKNTTVGKYLHHQCF